MLSPEFPPLRRDHLRRQRQNCSLGINVPHTQINADVLVLASTVIESAQRLKHIQSALDQVDAPQRPVFAFGTPAFNQHPKLRAKTPGIFLGETLPVGISTIERLMFDRKCK